MYFILAIGAAQGVILGTQLLFQQKYSSRMLAILLFFFAYRLLVEIGYYYGYGAVDHWTYQVFFEYNWVYGALLYFYVSSYLNTDFRWKKEYWLHLIPVGVEVFFSNWVKFQNYYWDGSIDSLPYGGALSYKIWEHTPIQFVIAAALILYYVHLSKKQLRSIKADEGLRLDKESETWISQILTVHQIYAYVVLVMVIIDFLFFDYAFNPFYTYPLFGALAIITYWLGLQGFLHRNKTAVKKIPKVDNSPLQALAARLKMWMEKERPYLNADLNLSTLAAQLDVKPYLLTQTLNQVVQQKFNDFINAYRIEEVKRLFFDPAYQNYTLLAIAHEAGFNSKASFNRVVKKVTGQSPSELRKASQLSK